VQCLVIRRRLIITPFWIFLHGLELVKQILQLLAATLLAPSPLGRCFIGWTSFFLGRNYSRVGAYQGGGASRVNQLFRRT
jgi:hypothetical protein